MIEKLIDNWLGNITERALQAPLCTILSQDGHEILHVTRHGPLEEGKDIITRAPTGEICAFQLKNLDGRRMTRSDWQSIQGQIWDLVNIPIRLEGQVSDKWHRSYIVVNGDFEEEVMASIVGFNQGQVASGYPERSVVPILQGWIKLRVFSIWRAILPDDLQEFRIFGRLYLEDGDGVLPKDQLVSILTHVLPYFGDETPDLSKKQFRRRSAAAAIITAIAISAYSRRKNRFAEVEAWLIALAYIAAAAERWKFEDRALAGTVVLIEEQIFGLLSELMEEVASREWITEGDTLTDQPFYRIRITSLCAAASALGLWAIMRGRDDADLMERLRSFVSAYWQKSTLWGEAAVGQVLCTYWFLRTIDATVLPDRFLLDVFEVICRLNAPRSTQALASPYYDAEQVVLSGVGAVGHEIRDSFAGHSYTAQSLLHILTRLMWKQRLRLMWPAFSKIIQTRFDSAEPWQMLLWRGKFGTNRSEIPPLGKEWRELMNESLECEGALIPSLLKKNPHIVPLFMVVYPHRLRADLVRWIDSIIWQEAIYK